MMFRTSNQVRRLLYGALAVLSALSAGVIAWRLRPGIHAPTPKPPPAPLPVQPIEAVTTAVETSPPKEQIHRGYYGLSSLFFAVIGVLTAQTGALSPLLLFSWLMSIALVVHYSLAGNTLLPKPSRWLANFRAWEHIAVVAFMVIAAILLLQTPAPSTPFPDTIPLPAGGLPLAFEREVGPLYHYLQTVSLELPGVYMFSRLFALLLIPAMYCLGRAVDSAQTGVVAAGFTAVSGWTLALGNSGAVDSGIAFFSALYLLALYSAQHSRQRAAYVWVGILWGFGWLISPWFNVMFWFFHLAALLFWLDDRQHLRRTIRSVAAALIVMLVVIAPFAAATLRAAQPTPAANAILDPLISFTDGLASSILMLAFQPILGVLLVLGLLIYIWRARWQHIFLPLALVVTLVPSATSPDLQHATMALPVSMTLAAVGVTCLARWLTTRVWFSRSLRQLNQ